MLIIIYILFEMITIKILLSFILILKIVSQDEHSNLIEDQLRTNYKIDLNEFVIIPALREVLDSDCLMNNLETIGNMPESFQNLIANKLKASNKSCIDSGDLKYFVLHYHEKRTDKIIASFIESETNLSIGENSDIELIDAHLSLNNTQLVKSFFSKKIKKENESKFTDFFLYYNKKYTPLDPFNQKQDIQNKLMTLFINQRNTRNSKKYNSTILILSGDQCSSTNPELVFHSELGNQTYTLKYEEVIKYWRDYQNFYFNFIEIMPFFFLEEIITCS